jgi:hypothetical protein
VNRISPTFWAKQLRSLSRGCFVFALKECSLVTYDAGEKSGRGGTGEHRLGCADLNKKKPPGMSRAARF